MSVFNNSTNNIFKNQPVTSKTASYSLSADDTVIEVTNTTPAVTLTLPAAAQNNSGKIYYLKDSSGTAGTTPITVATTSPDTLDGSASKSIGVDYGWMMVFSDGVNWFILDNSQPAGSFTWNAVSGTSQAAIQQNGYYCNNVALTTVTLPTTCQAGMMVAVVAVGAGGWQLAQNAGQTVRIGNQLTTTGATGYLQSSATGDVAWLLCVTANTTFVVTDAFGNIAIN